MNNSYFLSKHEALKHKPEFPDRTMFREAGSGYSVEYRVLNSATGAQAYLLIVFLATRLADLERFGALCLGSAPQ